MSRLVKPLSPFLSRLRNLSDRLTVLLTKVTAIDIFPADLPDAPDNLACEVWDLNETLSPTYPSNYYDLIHSRCVAPGIKKDRWRSYLRDLKRLLRSGGWVQLVEYYYIIQSDSGQLTAEHALQQWSDGYRAAMEQDRDPRVGRHLANMLTTAGYTEVQERSYRVPLGGWPAGERECFIRSLKFLAGWSSRQLLSSPTPNLHSPR